MEDQCLGVDIILNTINDKGVMADTNGLRELALEDAVLTRHEKELVKALQGLGRLGVSVKL